MIVYLNIAVLGSPEALLDRIILQQSVYVVIIPRP